MHTTCPHCQTVFRVNSEQLNMARGKVRCGYCHTVFNALDSLEDEWQESPPDIPDTNAEINTPDQEPTNPEFESITDETAAVSEPDSRHSEQDQFTAQDNDQFTSDSFIVEELPGSTEPSATNETHWYSEENPEYLAPEELQDTAIEPEETGAGEILAEAEPIPVPDEMATHETAEDEEHIPVFEIEDLTPPEATTRSPDQSPAPGSQAEDLLPEPPPADKKAEPESEPISQGYLNLAPPSTAGISGIYNEQDIPLALREELQQALEPGRGKNIFFWLFGILVLLAALAAQALYFYRVPLSQHEPLRPVIARMCAMLQCEMPLRNDIAEGMQTLGMISRSVSVDPGHEDRLRIQATIFNRAEYAQVFPIIEVSLIDEVGKVLAMRRFMPVDYVRDDNKIREGLGPKKIYEIDVEVVKPSVPVIAYQFDFR